MDALISYIIGPKLYMLYNQSNCKPYTPNVIGKEIFKIFCTFMQKFIELAGNILLTTGSQIKDLLYFAAPLLVPFTLFRYTLVTLVWAAQLVLIIYGIAFALRTFGRITK